MIIKCTKKDGTSVYINTQYILYFEAVPASSYTRVVMYNGEKIIILGGVDKLCDTTNSSMQ